MSDNTINAVQVFESESIEASGNVTSEPIPIWTLKPNGTFSLQGKSTGASSQLTIEYLISNDGVDYSTGTTEIVTGQAPGNYMLAFPSGEPMLALYMKIKVTETAGNAVVVDKLILAIQ